MMRPGGSKSKGAKFEREICRRLSRWLTRGKRDDCFWRSAMSGGRATVMHHKGIDLRQVGDITAVSPEGERFLRSWFVELKHVKKLGLGEFLVKGTGKLAGYWTKAASQARRHGLDPMIIACENNFPIIVVTRTDHLGHLAQPCIRGEGFDITRLEDWLQRPPREDRYATPDRKLRGDVRPRDGDRSTNGLAGHSRLAKGS